MPSVTYIEYNGTSHTVEAAPQRSLMQVAIDNGVAGILGDCGGSCSCATCHGYVDDAWLDKLPARSETEEFMLEGVPELRPNSRLCCQLKMNEALDGIVVRLPKEQV
jgi:ferredoxin, 2Fe-2S